MGFKHMKKFELEWQLKEGTPEGDEPLTIFDIGKEVYQMSVAEDEGFAYFNDVLFVAMKKTFGHQLLGSNNIDESMPATHIQFREVNKKSIPIMK